MRLNEPLLNFARWVLVSLRRHFYSFFAFGTDNDCYILFLLDLRTGMLPVAPVLQAKRFVARVALKGQKIIRIAAGKGAFAPHVEADVCHDFDYIFSWLFL